MIIKIQIPHWFYSLLSSGLICRIAFRQISTSFEDCFAWDYYKYRDKDRDVKTKLLFLTEHTHLLTLESKWQWIYWKKLRYRIHRRTNCCIYWQYFLLKGLDKLVTSYEISEQWRKLQMAQPNRAQGLVCANRFRCVLQFLFFVQEDW